MQEKLTALYERLSHDDDLMGESNGISNQSRCFQNMQNPMDLPRISILRMMEYPAQGLTARDLSA